MAHIVIVFSARFAGQSRRRRSLSIPRSSRKTVRAILNNQRPLMSDMFLGYRRRTNDEHQRYQEQYRRCNTDSARKAFVKKFATRWSEFSRLPYFNFAKMVVVDPMHNLFLGTLCSLPLPFLNINVFGVQVSSRTTSITFGSNLRSSARQKSFAVSTRSSIRYVWHQVLYYRPGLNSSRFRSRFHPRSAGYHSSSVSLQAARLRPINGLFWQPLSDLWWYVQSLSYEAISLAYAQMRLVRSHKYGRTTQQRIPLLHLHHERPGLRRS